MSAAVCSLGRAMLGCGGDAMSREQKLRALGAVWNTVQVRRYRVTIPVVHLGWVYLDLGSS